jgi:hypothetical protein
VLVDSPIVIAPATADPDVDARARVDGCDLVVTGVDVTLLHSGNGANIATVDQVGTSASVGRSPCGAACASRRAGARALRHGARPPRS